jgi:WD40 repeat protein
MPADEEQGGRHKWVPLVLVPLLVALLSSPVWGERLCQLVHLCEPTPPPVPGSVIGPSSTSTPTSEFEGTLSQVGDVRDVAFSHDGQLLATAAGNDGVALVWNTSNGEQVRTIAVGYIVDNVAFSADDRLLAGGDVYDPATGEHLSSVGTGYDAAFSPDGLLVATANGYQPNGVRLYDTSSGELVRVLTPEYASALAFSPDGQVLAVASGYRQAGVVLWNVATGQQLRTLAGGSEAVAFSPEGNRVATSGGGRTTLWDPATGESVRDLDAETVFGFSPDGELLAAAGPDRAVRLYDPATGNPIRTLTNVYADRLSFSPDSGRIATVSPDRTVRVVSLATG